MRAIRSKYARGINATAPAISIPNASHTSPHESRRDTLFAMPAKARAARRDDSQPIPARAAIVLAQRNNTGLTLLLPRDGLMHVKQYS